MSTNTPANSPSNVNSTPNLNVQLLMKIQGDRTKLWWNWSVILQVAVIGLSAYSTLTQNFTTETVLIIVPFMGIITPFIRWKADLLKGQYQSLLRKFEFYDGLDWKITTRERSEWLLRLSDDQMKEVTASNRMPDHYFASTKFPSAERLLENLEESAWWSSHLSGLTATVVGTLTFFVLLFSIIVLIWAINVAQNQASLLSTAKVVVSVISAVFSLGFVRLAVEYEAFSLSSGKFEAAACALLDSPGAKDEPEATKLLHEYQLTRAGSPMIPNWAWVLKQKRLNVVWKQERTRK